MVAFKELSPKSLRIKPGVALIRPEKTVQGIMSKSNGTIPNERTIIMDIMLTQKAILFPEIITFT